jgi:tellurite methyltransferase
MTKNRSTDFFETQFQGQVRSGDFALNPFETLVLPFVSGRVLDLGCGLGNLSLEAARGGCSVLALDASPTAVQRRALELLEDIKAHVEPGGNAIINVLIEGTTYLGMFEPGHYDLFSESQLRERFSGWDMLEFKSQRFDAPGSTIKAFATVVARRRSIPPTPRATSSPSGYASSVNTKIKAVAIGLAVDVGGSIAATILLVIAYRIVLRALGVSAEEIESVTADMPTDSALFYLAMLAGLAFSGLGGYVCARIAKGAELKVGAILAAISAGIGLAIGGDPGRLGLLIGLTLASVAAVFAGANLGRAKNRTRD